MAVWWVVDKISTSHHCILSLSRRCHLPHPVNVSPAPPPHEDDIICVLGSAICINVRVMLFPGNLIIPLPSRRATLTDR